MTKKWLLGGSTKVTQKWLKSDFRVSLVEPPKSPFLVTFESLWFFRGSGGCRRFPRSQGLCSFFFPWKACLKKKKKPNVFKPFGAFCPCRSWPPSEHTTLNNQSPLKGGRKTGAARKLSKSVENIFDTFWQFLTSLAQREKCPKYFLTCPPSAGPFCGPLKQRPFENTPCFCSVRLTRGRTDLSWFWPDPRVCNRGFQTVVRDFWRWRG